MAKRQTMETYLHESLGTRLCNSSQIVDEIGLGHTNTSIANGQGLALLVRRDTNVELRLRLQRLGVGEGGVSDFIESIRTVGDDFTKEDFLVGVESVCVARAPNPSVIAKGMWREIKLTDDKIEQLRDFSLESKAFRRHF
jgi:hypothetical protein